MKRFNQNNNFLSVLSGQPNAFAKICGAEGTDIKGEVRFFKTHCGVLVAAHIVSLPSSKDNGGSDIFGFHIHSGGLCSGNSDDPFADAGTHYNPTDMPHPCHAGDLPVLFSNNGYAFSVFLTDRFCVEEIIGKTVIIHSHPDDYTTQPSGNSGKKIACGQIRRFC